ncbi:MAG: hypothetical protein IJ190_06105 [Prevotella sp.]|nr:hypothetical protein [Prevotella sp.]
MSFLEELQGHDYYLDFFLWMLKAVVEHLDSFDEQNAEGIIRPQNAQIIPYTSEGYPSIEDLSSILRRHKEHVETIYFGKYNFALNRSNENRQEVMFIAR